MIRKKGLRMTTTFLNFNAPPGKAWALQGVEFGNRSCMGLLPSGIEREKAEWI